MNETSLGVLLERARHAFGSTHNASDHDSGVTAGEVTPPVVSPIVQSYIAGLQTSSHGKLAPDLDQRIIRTQVWIIWNVEHYALVVEWPTH